MRERSSWLIAAALLLALPGMLVHAFQGPAASGRPTIGRAVGPPAPRTTRATRFPPPLVRIATLRPAPLHQATSKNDNEEPDQEYRNAATKVLSNFMSSPEEKKEEDPFRDIDWDAPKINKVPLEKLAQALDAELYEKEWFVTGKVNPRYFAESFRFQDPDVQVTDIRKYAEGVRKIFNQETARAEIISTTVSTEKKPNVITCTWRLSGKVDIGPGGLTIKPYIVESIFTVDEETGLVVFQEDRFDLPGWDILLSALFPFLIGKLTAEPAPAPEPRDPPPKIPAGVL